MSKYGFYGGYERPPYSGPTPPEPPRFDPVKNHLEHLRLQERKRKNFDQRFQHNAFLEAPRLQKRTWRDRYSTSLGIIFVVGSLVLGYGPIIYRESSRKETEADRIYQAEVKKELEKQYGKTITSFIVK